MNVGLIRILSVLLWLACSTAQAETEVQRLLFGDHPLVGKLWDVKRQRYLNEAELLTIARDANAVLLGEVHDNRAHHEFQQHLLQELIASGARPSLLMEPFDLGSQDKLDAALAETNRDEALKHAAGLIKFGDWKMYVPLLNLAVDNKLPVVAANIPNAQLQPVIRQGFNAYAPEDIQRVAVEPVWSQAREDYLSQHIEGSHCGQISPQWRSGLVRGQRLRDALMVDAAMASFGRGIVAIVGRDHARRDIGMPLYLAARNPAARIVSVGLMEVVPGRDQPQAYATDTATGEATFDVLWFSSRLDRSGKFDPCAGLRGLSESAAGSRAEDNKPLHEETQDK
jgi:uncharacterized iron-regulated protein